MLAQAALLHSDPRRKRAQGKPGGRKVVAVISSVVAAVSPAAASARDPDAQGPFDAMVPAYSASKSAITRGQRRKPNLILF